MAVPKKIERTPLPRSQWGAAWNNWFWRQQQRNKAKRSS